MTGRLDRPGSAVAVLSAPLCGPVPLRAPPRGEGVLVHDATFGAWDSSFSVMRDVVNLGVDALNQAGAGLPHLPHGSLEELIVLPLSGDYGAIRANATACRDVSAALCSWSADAALLGVGAAVRWQGVASAAWLVRMQALAGRVGCAGLLVGRGARVLEAIATTAERLGVRVERLVVRLGRALARAVRSLLARVCGPAGWAIFAAELLTQGLSAVTDVVDDIRRVVDLVEELLALRDHVADWAREQREALDFLLDLPAVLRGDPTW